MKKREKKKKVEGLRRQKKQTSFALRSKRSSPPITAKITSKKPGSKAKKSINRRKHRRHPTPTLWVTEFSGDYRFVLAAGDLSEGGIFLKGRMMTSRKPSDLTLHFGKNESVQITAHPIYDRMARDSYGTGYRFTKLAPEQIKGLRIYLRNLD